MTEFANLPPDTSDGLIPAVAAVAKAVADRADELVDALGEPVIRKSGRSEVALILPHDDVRDSACVARSLAPRPTMWSANALVVHRRNGDTVRVPVTCWLHTAEEVSVY